MAANERQVFGRAQAADHSNSNNVRGVVLGIITAYFVQSTFQDAILPWGLARKLPEPRSGYAEIDPTIDNLRAAKKIFERREDGATQVKGAETVIVDSAGHLHLMTEEADLLKLSDIRALDDGVNMTAAISRIRFLGMGRPLGGAFTPDGSTLYIADAHLGLTRVVHPEDPRSTLEIVVDAVEEAPIRYANDVAIGPKSGKVYFTDSSDISPDRIGTRSYDTMYAAKMDLIRGGPGTGRLLEYDPSTDKVRVLASGIRFPNGVAVDEEETFVFFAETFGITLAKLNLQGDRGGTIDVLVESKDLTGYVDGVDCSSKKCYAAMTSAIVPIHKLFLKMPYPVDVFFRTLIMSLPRALAPRTKTYGGVVEVDPFTGDFRFFQDPTGEHIGKVAGVTYNPSDNKLYLGSLANDFIGVYDL